MNRTSMGIRLGWAGCAAGWLAIVGAASAQDAAPPAPPAPTDASADAAPEKTWLFGERRPSEWAWQIEPGAWFAALGGDLRVGGGPSRVDVGDLGIDDPEATPFGEIHLRSDRLTFTLGGWGFETSGTANSPVGFTAGPVVVAPGAAVDSEVELTSLEGMVSWRLAQWPGDPERAQERGVKLRLHLYGGARFYDLGAALASGGANVRDDASFLHPVGGGKIEVEIFEEFTVDLALDGGAWSGSKDSTSVSVMVGAQWRPWGNVGFQFGFRQQFLDLDAGSLNLDGSLGGLMASAVVKF